MPDTTAFRTFATAVCLLGLASCSSNPGAAHPETSAHAGAAPESGSPTAESPAAPAEPAGRVVKGAAIDDWFRKRGAKRPGTLNLEDSECQTVSAPVPSGHALSCEQHAAIKPWVRVSRRILFDVRDGRTLVLVNLISKVAPMDASGASGGACEGAVVVLNVKISGDGKSLTVADDAGCDCQQAEKRLSSGSSGDAKALELQAREMKQACSQRGAYVWEAHGFVPAQGE